MAIQFAVEDNEAQFILQVLGQLPTQSNAFPLYKKLLSQAQSQAPVQDAPPSDTPAQPEGTAQ